MAIHINSATPPLYRLYMLLLYSRVMLQPSCQAIQERNKAKPAQKSPIASSQHTRKHRLQLYPKGERARLLHSIIQAPVLQLYPKGSKQVGYTLLCYQCLFKTILFIGETRRWEIRSFHSTHCWRTNLACFLFPWIVQEFCFRK